MHVLSTQSSLGYLLAAPNARIGDKPKGQASIGCLPDLGPGLFQTGAEMTAADGRAKCEAFPDYVNITALMLC